MKEATKEAMQEAMRSRIYMLQVNNAFYSSGSVPAETLHTAEAASTVEVMKHIISETAMETNIETEDSEPIEEIIASEPGLRMIATPTPTAEITRSIAAVEEETYDENIYVEEQVPSPCHCPGSRPCKFRSIAPRQ